MVTTIYSADAWRAPELAEHWKSMVFLAYLCMPQVFFYGVFFLLGQVLNARDHFGPMMWAPPIANNIIQLLVLGLYLGDLGGHLRRRVPPVHRTPRPACSVAAPPSASSCSRR